MNNSISRRSWILGVPRFPLAPLRFDVADGKARAFTIQEDKLVLTAVRANR